MFCTNCGRKNSDDSNFCVACGTKLLHPVSGRGIEIPHPVQGEMLYGSTMNGAVRERTKKRTLRIVLIAVVTALLVAAAVLVKVLLFGGLSGKSEEKIVRTFIETFMHGNARSFMELRPETVMEDAVKSLGLSEDMVIAQLDEQFQNLHTEMEDEFGEGWSYTYSIQSVEPISEQELQEKMQEYREEKCALEIKEGKRFSLNVEVKGSEDTEKDDINIDLIKVGKKWYLDIISVADMF